MPGHWLLQHNPKHGPCSLGDGDWAVRRYRDRIAAGDDVAIWLAGPGGGVVAVGAVAVAAHPGDDGVPVIGVAVSRRCAISREELKQDPRFAGALIVRMPAGGNPFPVTAEQWQAIADQR